MKIQFVACQQFPRYICTRQSFPTPLTRAYGQPVDGGGFPGPLAPPHREYNKMNNDFAANWDEPSATFNSELAAPKQHPAAPLKQIVTIRLDVDMLEWFKGAGPGYQTRINQILREHMQAQRAKG
jgi:uncharacterized protein (DUF4415 family)